MSGDRMRSTVRQRARTHAASSLPFATLLVPWLAVGLHAQPPPPVPPASPASPPGTPSQTDPRPAYVAVRRRGPITIDGRLDDTAWASATPITVFRQQQPDPGQLATERTEIRVLYDDVALYVGARLFDRGGRRGVRALLTRRDQLLDGANSATTSDKVAVVLDPYRDRNTSVWFELNPLGVKGDSFNGDASFDPVWEGAAHVDSLGWTAEFRIPLSQLRFSRDSLQTWGLQLWRYIARRSEQDMWAYWRPNEAGGPAYFGALTGLALPRPPRQVELVPYVLSGDTFQPVAAGDPFHHSGAVRARVGTDLKVNLTSNLTLDATVNPDFGQVEVDPAVVNLSAFETFYQEKRPFFVANASYFSFGSFSCYFCSNTSNLGVFYSRRIGRAPQLTDLVASDAAYVDAPDATTILGAAKVTGRTKSGWTVGILDALTGRVDARYVPATASPTLTSALSPSHVTDVSTAGDAPPVLTQAVEPLTNYFLGRLRRDFNGGATRVGGVVTLTTRALADSLERTQLRARAAVAGADLTHYWKDRTYLLLAQVAVSDVAGDTAAIRHTEAASAHYFQRPDRHVRSDGLFSTAYDPTRTSLQGYGLYTRLAKVSGDWLWETAQNWRSPGFEVNDLSYLSRADYRWMNANVARQWTTPTRWYQNIFTVAGGQQQFNYDGDLTDRDAHLFGAITLPDFSGVNAFVIYHPSTFDDRLTRGGPVVTRSGYRDYLLSLNSDARRPVVGSFSVEGSRNLGTAGFALTLTPSVTVKPSSRVLLSVGPSFSRSVDAQQYVTAVTDPTATAFAGTRAVFATIDQHTLSVDLRLNTTFTPTLTLELYAQPFLASGRYTRFGEFARPRTLQMRAYGADGGTITATRDSTGFVAAYTVDPDGPAGPAAPFTIANPDFNARSLRGTAVLRWEYRPGSTLYLVWTQQRSGSAAYGDFDLARDRAALFRDPATNILQIKATYWLGR